MKTLKINFQNFLAYFDVVVVIARNCCRFQQISINQNYAEMNMKKKEI